MTAEDENSEDRLDLCVKCFVPLVLDLITAESGSWRHGFCYGVRKPAKNRYEFYACAPPTGFFPETSVDLFDASFLADGVADLRAELTSLEVNLAEGGVVCGFVYPPVECLLVVVGDKDKTPHKLPAYFGEITDFAEYGFIQVLDEVDYQCVVLGYDESYDSALLHSFLRQHGAKLAASTLQSGELLLSKPAPKAPTVVTPLDIGSLTCLLALYAQQNLSLRSVKIAQELTETQLRDMARFAWQKLLFQKVGALDQASLAALKPFTSP